MITRLSGILESVDGNRAVVAPIAQPRGVAAVHAAGSSAAADGAAGGWAIEVLLPAALAEHLASRLGSAVTLHTIAYLEQQSQGATLLPRLIGFASVRDRAFFELFTTVKGIGNRKALRALAAPVAEIASAIASRDVRRLQELPEIGKRLAETIVAELNGKVERFCFDADEPGARPAPPAGDAAREAIGEAARQALSALERLGEPRATAQVLIERASRQARDGASADELLAAAFALRG